MSKIWTDLKNKQLVHDEHGSSAFNTFCRDLLDKSESEITHALDRCKDFTGFFTVPAFRELCRPDPEALGLPSAEMAYIEACAATTPVREFKWSHPAVYHAGADTGWFDLRNGFANRRIFLGHYETRVRQVMAGEILEVPAVELIEEKPAPALSAKETHSRIKEMKARLGL